MTQIKCRDCGSMLEPEARGCPTCALNLEAERRLDRLLRFLVPALVLVVVVAGLLLYILT